MNRNPPRLYWRLVVLQNACWAHHHRAWARELGKRLKALRVPDSVHEEARRLDLTQFLG